MDMNTIKTFYENHPNNDGKLFMKNTFEPMKRLLDLGLSKPDFKGTQDEFIKLIEDNPKWASDATKSFYLRAVLWFLVHYLKAKNIKKVDKALSASTISKIENKPEIANIPIEDIQAGIQEYYGAGSMEDIFIQTFQAVPSRLDYYDIKIDDPEASKNYSTKTGTLIMKDYNKTAKNHGAKKVKLSPELQALINASLAENPREDLIIFGNADLSKAIRLILRKSGFPGTSLNTLRHSVASKPKMTPMERVELAKLMAHRPTKNLEYKRKTMYKN
jgi:hypothetical protein